MRERACSRVRVRAKRERVRQAATERHGNQPPGDENGDLAAALGHFCPKSWLWPRLFLMRGYNLPEKVRRYAVTDPRWCVVVLFFFYILKKSRHTLPNFGRALRLSGGG